MHCPQCGTSATVGQPFCRSCGLNLEKIAEFVGEQFAIEPSSLKNEITRLRERQQKFARWAGIAGLSTLGLILIMLIVVVSSQMILKGGAILPGVLLILLAIGAATMGVFQTYSKSLREKLANRPLPTPTEHSPVNTTAKLEAYRDPVPSVVESTTELLASPKKKMDD